MSAEAIAAWGGVGVVVIGAITTMIVRIIQEAKKGRYRRGEAFALRTSIDGLTKEVKRNTECTEALHDDIRVAFHIPQRPREVPRKDPTPRFGVVRNDRGEE